MIPFLDINKKPFLNKIKHSHHRFIFSPQTNRDLIRQISSILTSTSLSLGSD